VLVERQQVVVDNVNDLDDIARRGAGRARALRLLVNGVAL